MIGFDIFAISIVEVSVKGGVVTDFHDSKQEIVGKESSCRMYAEVISM